MGADRAGDWGLIWDAGWFNAQGVDPVPGRSEEIEQWAARFRRTADAIRTSADGLKQISTQNQQQQSEAVLKLVSKATDTEQRVRGVMGRFDAAAETLQTFHGVVVAEQSTTANYLLQAEILQAQIAGLTEQSALAANSLAQSRSRLDSTPQDEVGYSAMTKSYDADVASAQSMNAQLAAAQDELAQLKRFTRDAHDRWDQAGNAAAGRVDGAIKNDQAADGVWLQIADVLGNISAWVGTAALLVNFIPIIGQALSVVLTAVALITAAVAFTINLVNAISSKSTAMRAVWSGVAALSFGAGRAVTAVVGRALRSTAAAAASASRVATPAVGAVARGVPTAGKSASVGTTTSRSGFERGLKLGWDKFITQTSKVFDDAFVSVFTDLKAAKPLLNYATGKTSWSMAAWDLKFGQVLSGGPLGGVGANLGTWMNQLQTQRSLLNPLSSLGDKLSYFSNAGGLVSYAVFEARQMSQAIDESAKALFGKS